MSARDLPPVPAARRPLAVLAGLDRRLIFLVIGVGVALPLLFPLNLPVGVSREATAYYEAIEALAPGDVVILAVDYEPDTMAEMDPMTVATLARLFEKDVRVIALADYAGGTGIAARILRETARERGKAYGTDYIFLGYNPDYSATMLRMGESIRATFPTDHYGTPTAQLPLLANVDDYSRVKLIVSISSSAMAEYWILFAHGKFGEKIIAGNTAIQAVLIYPYFQTGQLAGFLGGLKGAAEYEQLTGRRGSGMRGMDAQSVAHALIVAFIVLGNIGFFVERSRRRDAARRTHVG